MPAVVTVIDSIVSPVLHNNVPVYPDAINKELPQLFTTVTTGASAGEFNGVAMSLPGVLVQPFIVWVTV